MSLAKILKGQGGITKEQVEEVLTGTIKSHNHDTEYEIKEYETDVWDGTSISDSLQGSGTKDDPYLIQSCADWLHLYVNGPAGRNIMKEFDPESFDGFKQVVKVMKNLDFGNKTIPYPTFIGSGDFFLGWEFDGNNATISNFVANKKGGEVQVGCIPAGYPLFIHNFNLNNIQIETNIEDGNTTSFFSTLYDYMYNLVVNNVINGKCVITGNATETNREVLIVTASGFIASNTRVAAILETFLEENGYFLGTNIAIEDNTTKDEGVQVQIGHISQTYTKQELNGYDSSFSNATGISTGGYLIGEDNPITGMFIIANAPNFYYDNTKSNGLVKQGIDEHTPAFVSENGKTTEEMKSDAFVAELNSKLPKPAFMKDPKGGTPVLAQYGGVKYDGYVKQSTFEAFKKNIPSTVKPNDFIYELKPEVYVLTTDSTSEDISAAVDGESGFKEIIQAVKDGNRLVIRGTNDEMVNITINQDVQCSMYKEADNGDMELYLYGHGYTLWGGAGGILCIGYTKSSNTFKCQLIGI